MVKKKNINQKKKEGFTLIELLATIVIIGIISTIGITIYTNTINKAKDNSKILAMNNLKTAAEYYSKENSDIKWITEYNNYQPVGKYICTTVQDLINAGYFKEDFYKNDNYDNKINNNTLIEIHQSNNYADTSVTIHDNNINMYQCLASAMNQNLKDINIIPQSIFTDRIYFDIEDENTNTTEYGITYNDKDNNKIIKKCENNKCELTNLLMDEEYPFTLCPNEDNTISCKKSSFRTELINKPNIDINPQATERWDKTIEINYNNENIYNKGFNYFKSDVDTISNQNVYQCENENEVNNNICQKTNPTKTIIAEKWYYTTEENIKMTTNHTTTIPNSPKIYAKTKDETKNTSENSETIKNLKRKTYTTIRFKPNGGTLATQTTSTNGTVYNWKVDSDGYIYLNNKIYEEKYMADEYLSTTGVADYNNSHYLSISRAGYIVPAAKEWTCLEGCNKSFNQNYSYQGKDFCDSTNDNCTVTLGVNWEVAEYTISYSLNNGTHGTNHPNTAKVGEVLNISNPTRSGYTFAGWTATSLDVNTAKTGTTNNPTTAWNGTTKITNTYFKNLRNSTGTVALTANWTAKTYTISYTLNGGSYGTNHPTTGTVDSVVTINNPTKVGYTFTGWTPSGWNANTATYGTSTSAVTTTWSSSSTHPTAAYYKNLRMESGTVTLTANWTRNFTCGQKTKDTTYMGKTWYTIENNTSTCVLALKGTVGNANGNKYNDATGTGTASVYNYIKDFKNNTNKLSDEYSAGLITAINTDGGTEGAPTDVYWSASKTINFNVSTYKTYTISNVTLYNGSYQDDNSFTSGIMTDKTYTIKGSSSSANFATGTKSLDNNNTTYTITNGNITSSDYKYNSADGLYSQYFTRIGVKSSTATELTNTLQAYIGTSTQGSNRTVKGPRLYIKPCGGPQAFNDYVWRFKAYKSGSFELYGFVTKETWKFNNDKRYIMAAGDNSITTVKATDGKTYNAYNFHTASNCKTFKEYKLSNLNVPVKYRPKITVKK